MSSLWTPDGEHRVPPSSAGGSATPGTAPGDAPVEPDEDAEAAELRAFLEQLSPEEREQAEAMARELAEARARLAATPASVVVANHVMGLYELAAIHLGNQPPGLTEAKLAIDAMGAVVDALPGRLGEHETTLRDALQQLRLAFVQLTQAANEA